MKQFFTSVLLLWLSFSLHAQHPGFSRLYRHAKDSALVREAVSALLFDSTGQQLFFCSNGTYMDSGTSYAVFYKTDMQGNVLLKTVDSLDHGNVAYNCVANSQDGEYLYWAGSSYVQGDMSSLSWKIRKTDKSLNLIWEKLYPANALSNTISNIKCIDSTSLMLLCFDYTQSNTLGLPVKSKSMFMRKIDTTGNIIADYHPVAWPETDAYGLECTSDGGFMINGSTGTKGYILKADSAGTHLWHQFYGMNNNMIRFRELSRQPGAADSFFCAGQSINGDKSNALALKTDNWGAELWRQEFEASSYNYGMDTMFAVTTAPGQSVLFAGTSYGQFVIGGDGVFQSMAGYMAKTDKDGTVLWSKYYRKIYEMEHSHSLYKVVPLPDGGYVAGGAMTEDYGASINKNSAWLVRIDSNGCYNQECREPLAVQEASAPKEKINLFPSPSSGPLHLIKTTPFPAGTTVTLSDISGKVLRTLESPAGKTQQVYQLRGSLLPGMYFLRITMGAQVVEKKWILTF